MTERRCYQPSELGLEATLAEQAGEVLKTNSELVGPEYCRSGLKRAFDILVAGPSAAITLPLVINAGIKILKKDGWPPLVSVSFEHPGLGHDVCEWKLRTMVVGARALEVAVAKGRPLSEVKADDFRITEVGQTLRQGGVDELPQLYNVLLGHLSMVGPRAPSQADWVYIRQNLERQPFKAFVEILTAEAIRYGLAGFYAAFVRNTLKPEARYALEVLYCQRASLPADIKLVALSFGKLRREHGTF